MKGGRGRESEWVEKERKKSHGTLKLAPSLHHHIVSSYNSNDSTELLGLLCTCSTDKVGNHCKNNANR